MSHIPDLTTIEHTTAIGWLHPSHPFNTGPVPKVFADRLREFARLWHLTVEAVDGGACGGFHTCEFCEKFLASGSIYVPAGTTLFHAPEMIHHYVEKHAYLPPAEFIDAVLACPLPETIEYVTAAASHKR